MGARCAGCGRRLEYIKKPMRGVYGRCCMDLAMSKMKTMVYAEKGDYMEVMVHAAETRRLKEDDTGKHRSSDLGGVRQETGDRHRVQQGEEKEGGT